MNRPLILLCALLCVLLTGCSGIVETRTLLLVPRTGFAHGQMGRARAMVLIDTWLTRQGYRTTAVVFHAPTGDFPARNYFKPGAGEFDNYTMPDGTITLTSDYSIMPTMPGRALVAGFRQPRLYRKAARDVLAPCRI